MGEKQLAGADEVALVSVLEASMPAVYGYLLHRVRDRATAEDLTSETLESAFMMVRRESVAIVTAGWLIGIARHKLADHWRRVARSQAQLAAVADELRTSEHVERFEASRADEILAQLNPSQRAVLTFRYVDGLSVPETALLLGRTVAATENLLTRSKRAFRARYDAAGGDLDD